jgi:hypothetical protein
LLHELRGAKRQGQEPKRHAERRIGSEAEHITLFDDGLTDVFLPSMRVKPHCPGRRMGNLE